MKGKAATAESGGGTQEDERAGEANMATSMNRPQKAGANAAHRGVPPEWCADHAPIRPGHVGHIDDHAL